MIFVNSLLFMVLLEVCLVSLVCLGVLGYRFRYRRRSHAEDAGRLVEHFRQALDDRRMTLRQDLDPGWQACPQSVVDVDSMIAQEADFYRFLLELLQGGDASAWSQLEPRLKALLAPYRMAMTALNSHCGQLGNQAALVAGLRQDVEQALDDVEVLATQLHEARLTLSRVSAEYADLFVRHAGSAELEASRQRMLDYYERCLKGRLSTVEKA